MAGAAHGCSRRGRPSGGLIEHLGLGPCDIIGYSLGGYIAQELAVTRAGLVRRLVLLAGAGPAPAYAVAHARAAVDLARAIDPPPPSFDVADLLLSLHPMTQLQDDDDAVKITISLIEAATAGRAYFNTAAVGLASRQLAGTYHEFIDEWAAAGLDYSREEQAAGKARSAVARLIGADAADIALIPSVSSAAGLVAGQFGPAGPGREHRDRAAGVQLELLPLASAGRHRMGPG